MFFIFNPLSDIDNKVSGLAFDFGTIFYPGWKSLRFGMSVRNFAPKYDFGAFSAIESETGYGYGYGEEEEEAQAQEGRFELPLTFAMGLAMDLFDLSGGAENQTLLFSIDAVHPRDFSERVHIGFEYELREMFAVRGGYKFNYDEEGLTLDCGVKAAGVRFDYAYGSLKHFDALSRFSISYGF